MDAASVLLVDDEVEFTDTLGERLRTRGLSVSTAASGDEALGLLEREDFDVILLDLYMPGRDGIDSLREIKLRRPLTEVIMLSGKGAEATAIDCMRGGAFDFLTKPPDMCDLLAKIKAATERRKQHQARISEALGAASGISATEMAPHIEVQPAVRASAKGDACEGIVLVLGNETVFSKALMDYALDMAGRLSYEVMALNAAGLSTDILSAFPSARLSLLQDFRTHSEGNAVVFREAAAERDIPFSHVVKHSGPDEAVQEVQREVGPIDFVVSESLSNAPDPEEGPVVLVYSPA